MTKSVRLDSIGGVPAWRVRVVQPGRFEKVPYTLETELFKLRAGALFAINLQLFDEPAQPYFVHRVLDLSDPAVAGHLDACSGCGRLVLAFDRVGQEEGYCRTLELDGGRWRLLLRDGQAYNATIEVQGRRALDDFLEVFLPASRELGVRAGWNEVASRLRRRA